MQTILIPYDLADPSQRALGYVLTDAVGPRPAKVHLLNVQAPPYIYEECLTDYPIRNEDQSRIAHGHSILRPAARRLIEAGLWCETHVVMDAIEQAVADQAIRLGCDAIVMGEHLASALERRFVRTTPSNTVYLVGIPVTLIE
jgi:nucleotide-binding universal stress UspA family protein